MELGAVHLSMFYAPHPISIRGAIVPYFLDHER